MKRFLAVLLSTIAVVALAWLFFEFGGNQSEPSSDKQAILSQEDTRFSKGDPDAPVKIIEYADILCPYCAKANSDVIPQIETDYIDTGKAYYEVRVVGMISPDSMRAAEGAYCSADQNMFWKYIDEAYTYTWDNHYSKNESPSNVKTFNEAHIADFISQVGITKNVDKIEWQQCMDENKYQELVMKNKEDMSKMEAYGTPHFSINGKDYNGSPPYSAFKGVIEAALKEKQDTN